MAAPRRVASGGGGPPVGPGTDAEGRPPRGPLAIWLGRYLTCGGPLAAWAVRRIGGSNSFSKGTQVTSIRVLNGQL